VVDAMNCLRKVKLEFPQCDGSRTIAWGGSQGAHIVLLATAFAPRSFALTIECCGIASRMPGFDKKRSWAQGGDIHQAEIRTPLKWVDRFANKVFVFHGTADDVVDVKHGRALEEALDAAGVEHEAHYTDGGRHFLDPVTGRDKETVKHCSGDIMSRRLAGPDDFEAESEYRFECTGAVYAASFSGGWFALTTEDEGGEGGA
jgi:acetyl esterase/lipase